MALSKILIVDDEPDILRLVEVILEGTSEWDVLTASDGEEALTLAKREHPAVILLDGRMPGPGGSGFDTLERLRRDPDTSSVPVILMSALAHGSDPAIPPGFAGVIGKPFDPLTLPKQIRDILGTSP
ncbi:MAG TPA: response regulator [Polyangiaceae bacterium]